MSSSKEQLRHFYFKMSNFTDDFCQISSCMDLFMNCYAKISKYGFIQAELVHYFSGFDALQSEVWSFWWYIFQSINMSYMLEITRGFHFIYYL